MGPRTRAIIASLLLLAEVSASCTSWRVQSITPRELLEREHPPAIQVRELGGMKYVLGNPRVEGDSLTGYVKHDERRIPMAAVDKVAVRRFNAVKTAGFIVGIPVAAIAVFLGVYGLGCAAGADCTVAP